jgi:TPR repeat protein
MRYLQTIFGWLVITFFFPVSGNVYAENTGVGALKAYAVFKMGDYEKAYELWKELADEGNTTAMNNIGNLHENGLGFPRDMDKAVQWYRQSAEAGDRLGQLHLGTAYEQGAGVPRDNYQAANWFRKSAEQGDQDAQFNLGVMLITNYGTEQPPSTTMLKCARYWLEKARLQNHPEARVFLQMLP